MLGLSPYEYDFKYSINDISLLVDKKRADEKTQMEQIRFHAFLIMAGLTGKLNRPQDLVLFNWEEEEEKIKEQIDEEEFKKRAENFRKAVAKKYGNSSPTA